MIFFYSDLHLNHFNIISHCKRPFNSLTEMNTTIINNWNSVVTPSDTVYVVGDFIYKNKNLYYPQFNGHIITVDGDHDNFKSNRYLLNIKINEQYITICHWPMLSWAKSHYGSWMIHGHHHWNTNIDKRFQGKIMNVCADIHNFIPVSFDKVTEFMSTKEKNWNQI